MTTLFDLYGTAAGGTIRVPGADAIDITAAELDGANRGQRPDLLTRRGQVYSVVETDTLYVAYQGSLVPAYSGAPLDKLRSAAHGADAKNAFNQPAWAPAPNWAPLTTYGVGSTVRSTVLGSLDCIYLYCGTVTTPLSYGGVSAASGGPSGTGYGLISDGTCVWQYLGKASTLVGYPLYSTVIPTTSSSVMDGYLAVVSTANFAAMGLTARTHSIAAPLFAISNSNFENGVQVSKNTGTAAAPNRSTSALNSVIRFATNCNKWLALVGQNAVYQNSTYYYGITVNGRWLSDQPATTYVGATVNPGATLLDLSNFPIGEKVIEVYIRDQVIFPLNAIALGADEYVYPYYSPTQLKLAIEGDSIGNMTYMSSIDIRARLEVQIGQRLGVASVLNNCIGGTGAIKTNGGSATTYSQRLDDIVRFNPDVLVVFGAHNDADQPQAARRAAFIAYFQAVRARMPDVKVVVWGGTLLGGESLVLDQLSCEQDLEFCVAQMADSGFLFVPVLTAPVVRVSSANGRFFQAGGVPAAYTDGHPIPGYYYSALPQLCNAIRKWIG